MHLKRLAVDGFRNLEDVHLVPHPQLTVFVGDNGQGKTNLLEAIHLVTALRPLRPVERAGDLVGFGRPRATLRAAFESDGTLPVDVVCEPHGRKATIAGKAVRDVSELALRLSAVSFVPEDASFLRGSPEGRRRALDRVAFSISPSFAGVARRFEEALLRRNRLLKAQRVDEDQLDSYSTVFAAAAAELTLRREDAVRQWAPAFNEETRALGGDVLAAQMRYEPNVAARGGPDATAPAGPLVDLTATIVEALAAARPQELRRRSTAVGPHLDDVGILRGDRKARFLASQGEARALVLALKLAHVRLITLERGHAPLLLLDDVAGELDPARGRRLFETVQAHGVQTFVTTTTLATLPAELRSAAHDVHTLHAGHIVSPDVR